MSAKKELIAAEWNLPMNLLVIGFNVASLEGGELQLAEELDDLCVAAHVKRVVFDFGALNILQSRSLSVILRFVAAFRKEEGRIVFCNLGPNARSALVAIGIERFVTIAEDRAAAAESLGLGRLSKGKGKSTGFGTSNKRKVRGKHGKKKGSQPTSLRQLLNQPHSFVWVGLVVLLLCLWAGGRILYPESSLESPPQSTPEAQTLPTVDGNASVACPFCRETHPYQKFEIFQDEAGRRGPLPSRTCPSCGKLVPEPELLSQLHGKENKGEKE
jgi:anti-anti-sigma regulatory factor